MQNGQSQKDQNMVFNTNYRLMQVKSNAECSKGSILQYFRPSLSYQKDLCFVYFTQVFFFNKISLYRMKLMVFFSIKYRYSYILLKEHKLHLSRVFFAAITLVTRGVQYVMKTAQYIPKFYIYTLRNYFL